jgi:hypothetical protein
VKGDKRISLELLDLPPFIHMVFHSQ